MKTRKLVLLIACAVLLVVCILQGVLKGSDKVKTYDIKDTPDQLVITTPEESYTIVFENDTCYVGDKKYPANETAVDTMVEALTSIKVLDKVASANTEAAMVRYELNEGKAITAVAKKGGKILRTVIIGKDSTAGSQSYILLDGGKDVYLATGNLRSSLNKTVKELRGRGVLNLDKNDISAVTVRTADGNTDFTVSRVGSGEDTSWLINQPDVLVDGNKAADWFGTVATLVTPVWHDDADLKGNELLHAEIRLSSKTVTLDIFEIPAATEDEKPVYFGFSSETPYQFELAAYSVQKFQKTVADLIQ